jgi:hypothetical protein
MSRAHKQLDTWFKNREIAQRAFNKKPEEPKPEEKNMDKSKLKEAEVKLRTPTYHPGEQEGIMGSEQLPKVDAAVNLSADPASRAPGDSLTTPKVDAKKKVKAKKEVAEARDPQEYDYEGQMAKEQLRTICRNAQALMDHLSDTENLPEWIQTKITLSDDYITTCANYMMSKVQESANTEPPFDKPYKTVTGTVTDKSGAKHGPMSKARDLAAQGLKAASQMNKLKPKAKGLNLEAYMTPLLGHALLSGTEKFDAETGVTATDTQATKEYTEDLNAGDLVQCLKTNRVGKVVSCDGKNCTVEFYPGTEKSETEHGHPDWYQKLTDEDPQHFHTARSTTDATDYPQYESANHTGEVLSEGTKEGERSWNIKGLKPAGHGIVGKKVRSYDFPGFNDAHYLEGHVVHETPYSYHVRTTKVVRSGKEHPISVHNTQFEAPKGKHLFYGAAGVYHMPKEHMDAQGAENPRNRATFGSVRATTHQRVRRNRR